MGTDIEAVIFDWGGTLTPWHTIDTEALWLAVADELDPVNAAAVAAALAEAEALVWARARDEHRSGTLAEVAELANVILTDPARAVYELGWEPHSLTDPQAPAVLLGLRERGIRVGVLSNTIWSREYHERIFARDGVLGLFDGAVYSSEIPWTKPHPEAFLAAVAATGATDPARCVFVGDRLFDDIYGARNVGMRAVFVPHSAVPPHQVGHTLGEPDATIHNLGELLPLVDSWRAGPP
ncbi:MAG: HAD-superfamily hydrolase, subfamily variant 3 [Actinomycetia bacterium]|jgi:putative hydrolase of the HAD superfamily|nr:HAD-superfamily hydrolase, subfamily variant 3 [Actinomycetes bacterium]MDX6703350.1 putative hydrolase of the superfamily [Baekduia sp.]